MSTSVMSDDAVPLVAEEEHLQFEVVAVQRPTVGEEYDWSVFVAPVFIEEGLLHSDG
jgi:hypothetical protein